MALARLIAADPNPLAPARYAADGHVSRRGSTIGYVPFLVVLVAEHDVGAVVPPTDLASDRSRDRR